MGGSLGDVAATHSFLSGSLLLPCRSLVLAKITAIMLYTHLNNEVLFNRI